MSVASIILNGERRDIGVDIDLETLVNELALPSKRLAVELNGTVIRRSEWQSTVVSDGDKLEVVHFVGGG